MARQKKERNISYDDVRKCYYVTLEFGRDPDTGRQVKTYKTFPTLKEARAALQLHEVARNRGEVVRPSTLTLAQWLTQWMDNVVRFSRAVTTVYAYDHMIQGYIIPLLGDTPLQKLTPQQLQGYYATLMRDRQLHSNTVRKHHDLLNAAPKTAVRQGVLLRNPAQQVEAPRYQKPDIRFYTPEELQALLELCRGDRVEVLVKLAALLGLRREEILGLTWDCVDFDRRLITIRQVRTAAGRTVVDKQPKTPTSQRKLYIPDDLEEVLRREWDRQQHYRALLGEDYDRTGEERGGYVFVHEDGRPVRPNYASDLFTAFIRKNGLPYITLHGLRHSFASIANAKGIPIYDIGKALGHSSSATTSKVYTHLLDQNHEGMLKRLWETDRDAKR